jgi:hypothetical protein
MTPVLKPSGTKRVKLIYDGLLSSFAFNFKLRRYMMACPGGCIGGGGQPKTKDKGALKKRMEAIYSLDRCAVVR